MSEILEIRDLCVTFVTDTGVIDAVDNVSLSVDRGRTVAIVGESGSGKSVTSLAVMGLHDLHRARVDGSILLDGEELVGATASRLRRLRGSQVAMIFQDPMSSLHPLIRVGAQLVEAVRIHQKVSRRVARERSIEILTKVGIPGARQRALSYPHQLSGGMRQRVMIAMALINNPKVLIADEPTTALDVTVQAQLMDLMLSLQDEYGTAIVLITHNLGLVAGLADDVAVMYGGQIVEYGAVRDIFYRPQMPYTWGLLNSLPQAINSRAGRMQSIPGMPPSPFHLPAGCMFQPRCQYCQLVPHERCLLERPPLEEVAPGHLVRCHLPVTVREGIAKDRVAAQRNG